MTGHTGHPIQRGFQSPGDILVIIAGGRVRGIVGGGMAAQAGVLGQFASLQSGQRVGMSADRPFVVLGVGDAGVSTGPPDRGIVFGSQHEDGFVKCYPWVESHWERRVTAWGVALGMTLRAHLGIGQRGQVIGSAMVFAGRSMTAFAVDADFDVVFLSIGNH